MQYEAKTPREYMAMLEPDWRKEKLETLRSLIKLKAPDFTEAINYKMLSYGNEQGVAFHLNAQKNYVSLYVGDANKIDPDRSLLNGLDTGKGCIRFKKSLSIKKTRIDEFLERAVQYWKDGKDIGC
ncbi:DUF1801 domain-containing protein [Fulvivirga sp. M361]|uniref:iron chaperone n=1 Tax=Fulvivirga sp. M361 TaxID=2594266 RepID=UPI0011799874|nr:DUF1801 domain-containing protein [Fulvivirga sp. M361]TRX52024.1 DUF1801 domain-containing protein [Fulvivirga sp. M361]